MSFLTTVKSWFGIKPKTTPKVETSSSRAVGRSAYSNTISRPSSAPVASTPSRSTSVTDELLNPLNPLSPLHSTVFPVTPIDSAPLIDQSTDPSLNGSMGDCGCTDCGCSNEGTGQPGGETSVEGNAPGAADDFFCPPVETPSAPIESNSGFSESAPVPDSGPIGGSSYSTPSYDSGSYSGGSSHDSGSSSYDSGGSSSYDSGSSSSFDSGSSSSFDSGSSW